jgi:hypothetical protein
MQGSTTITTPTTGRMPTSEEIVDARIAGNVDQLRRWHLSGINVLFSAEPLVEAASYAQLDMLRFLVQELGANANQTSPYANANDAGLHLTAMDGNLEVVICLISERGANVCQAAHNGITPIFVTALFGRLPVIAWLLWAEWTFRQKAQVESRCGAESSLTMPTTPS